MSILALLSRDLFVTFLPEYEYTASFQNAMALFQDWTDRWNPRSSKHLTCGVHRSRTLYSHPLSRTSVRRSA